jgi:hypothetical protein
MSAADDDETAWELVEKAWLGVLSYARRDWRIAKCTFEDGKIVLHCDQPIDYVETTLRVLPPAGDGEGKR